MSNQSPDGTLNSVRGKHPHVRELRSLFKFWPAKISVGRLRNGNLWIAPQNPNKTAGYDREQIVRFLCAAGYHASATGSKGTAGFNSIDVEMPS